MFQRSSIGSDREEALANLARQAAADGVPPKAIHGVMDLARRGQLVALRQIADAPITEDDNTSVARRTIANTALSILNKS